LFRRSAPRLLQATLVIIAHENFAPPMSFSHWKRRY